MSDDTISNCSRERSFSDIVDARYSRREMLGAAGKFAAMLAVGGLLRPAMSFGQSMVSGSSLAFAEISQSTSRTHQVAEGYETQLLVRWGDKIVPGAPDFDPLNQLAESQKKQFGFNNDFLAFMPFPVGSGNSTKGLLCSNHEYTSTHLMFPGIEMETARDNVTREQVDVEMAAHGHGTLEIERINGNWSPVIGSPYNRRMSPYDTDITVSGPAAGHARMRTTEDPEGKTVRGTFGNCAGGVTPWGSVLVSEENFDAYFSGDVSKTTEERNHMRYGVAQKPWYGWNRFYDRYDVTKEPNEPNRFGWVVEYDPYDPECQPVKRTALGRFKHETATTTLAPDGRVVVYSGDDQKFEYLYRFVSHKKYQANKRKNNFGVLDEGVLSVAKFSEDGTFQWLPLVYGQGPLTESNGFSSQGDVLIETRRAADLVGATPMDRPEGIAVHPKTGRVFVSLTNNNERTENQVNAVNTRARNIHGHILELAPPAGDHAAERFEWRIFLRGGNPASVEDNAYYAGAVSEHGWFSCPDNLAMDPSGRLWIATDGQPKTLHINDALFAAEVTGESAGITRRFFNGPAGCEITGPCFTPDGTTLFLSVQHPGDGEGATFDRPTSHWPDFKKGLPPRPSVVAITKKDGGIIGS